MTNGAGGSHFFAKCPALIQSLSSALSCRLSEPRPSHWGAFFILLLSLLIAYLLEPVVTFQEHYRLTRKNRRRAIAQVYLIGALVLGSLGYEFGPHLVPQIKNLNAAVPEILQDLSSGRTAADPGVKHGLNLGEQQGIYDWPPSI